MYFSNATLTAEQRIQKAMIALMANPRYEALSGVFMIGTKTVTDDPKLPTAATNGKDVIFNRGFVDQINDAQLRAVILHEEEGHKLHRHLTVWDWMFKEDAQLANFACDYYVNLVIHDANKDDGFATIMDDWLFDERFRGMSCGAIYNKLKQEGGVKSLQNKWGGNPQQTADEHRWEEAQSVSEEDKQSLAQDIEEALRQGVLASKKSTGGDRRFDALLAPQVDWREALREFISSTCKGSDYSTYARPNRRLMSQGIIMPTGVSEQVEELVVAVDTSGSISGGVLNAFLSEVVGIAKVVSPSKIRLLYWGSSVVGDEEYAPNDFDNLPNTTKPVGGGGTDVTCVTSYMQDKQIRPQAAVVLTDGHLWGGWGAWSCPTLWAIIDNPKATPDVGKALHIEEGNL